ncbi:MAG: helix-turn-helix transcriptional regulator [Oscillospiraceae bacterium]|nr:helix-turn-helix transcriptional regulator [Oscillospiraceae bacterium]
MKIFSEKLVERRAELGLSQAELSARSGIGKRTITSYETDGRIPQPAQLYKLAKALGVSPEYLKNDAVTDPLYGAESMEYIESARRRFGARQARDAEALLQENAALFAGGDISEEAKDAFFQAVMKAYIDCKEAAKKTYSNRK